MGWIIAAAILATVVVHVVALVSVTFGLRGWREHVGFFLIAAVALALVQLRGHGR